MLRSRRQIVSGRAGHRCEYCHLPAAEASLARFHVEHIIARKHGGSDRLSNLCFSWHRCNYCKSSNLTGVDRVTRRIVPLFHPRRQHWARHFKWRGSVLLGLTPVGRATIAVLSINHPERVELRQSLIHAGIRFEK